MGHTFPNIYPATVLTCLLTLINTGGAITVYIILIDGFNHPRLLEISLQILMQIHKCSLSITTTTVSRLTQTLVLQVLVVCLAFTLTTENSCKHIVRPCESSLLLQSSVPSCQLFLLAVSASWPWRSWLLRSLFQKHSQRTQWSTRR